MDYPNIQKDPLSNLVVNTNELNRAKLAELLEGYCGISTEGGIHIMPNFIELDAPSKLLAVLLAKKASAALGYSESDRLLPKEIESITGIPGGTVRSRLMELRQKRFVDSENGNYSIPNHAISKVVLVGGKVTKRNTSVTRSRPAKTRSDVQKTESLIKLMEIDQSQIKESMLELLLTPGKYLERSLAVLQIARGIGIDSLTPGEVSDFLKEKVRVSVKRENISLALGRGTRYIDRFKDNESGGYRYRVMAAGDKLLSEQLDSVNKTK